jgi:hypothetical protein
MPPKAIERGGIAFAPELQQQARFPFWDVEMRSGGNPA